MKQDRVRIRQTQSTTIYKVRQRVLYSRFSAFPGHPSQSLFFLFRCITVCVILSAQNVIHFIRRNTCVTVSRETFSTRHPLPMCCDDFSWLSLWLLLISTIATGVLSPNTLHNDNDDTIKTITTTTVAQYKSYSHETI